MKNKKIVFFSLCIIILIIICISYRYIPTKPSPFYSKNTTLNKINELYNDAEAKTIQDVVYVDKTHLFTPFITSQKSYGLCYWEWKNRKWNINSIDTDGGNMQVWKVKPNDPSSYVIVWNFNSKNEIEKLKFRLIQKRNFLITNGID